jgi:hypothetical protein
MAILGYKNSRQYIRGFGLAEWLATRSLEGWLELATDGLEVPARQRVANEIGAHYAESVSAHLAAGEPELSAQATALAELGDPQEAALNFQKSHLTKSEAKSLERIEKLAAKPLFSFRTLPLDIIPLAGFALLFSHVNPNSRLLLDAHFFAGFVLVAYAGFRLIPRLLCARTMPRNSFLRKLALCYLVSSVALLVPIALIPYMEHPSISSAGNAAFIFFLYGCAFNPGFRIWNKLRKMGDERNDLPPWRTTAF